MTSRLLLIDDDANKGWHTVLDAILLKEISEDIVLEAALNKIEANEKLKSEWDIIFLDLRFGENDFNQMDPEKLSGALVLKEIRQKGHINFATPVIVFTASRKIWNIDKMMDLGADGYFIKESPYDRLDSSFSKANYSRFIKLVKGLIRFGKSRKSIWHKTVCTIKSCNACIEIKNIRERIEEKLLIGYALLTGVTSEFESKNFYFARESLAYIVYWSILEEISKAFYERNWNDDRDYDWKIKNSTKYLVKKLDEFTVEIGIIKDKVDKFYKTAKNPLKVKQGDQDFERWTDPRLSIRYQIIGLLVLKYENKDFQKRFIGLNDLRNKQDFIHSSAEAIMNETFRKNYNEKRSFQDCYDIFLFIHDLLLIN